MGCVEIWSETVSIIYYTCKFENSFCIWMFEKKMIMHRKVTLDVGYVKLISLLFYSFLRVWHLKFSYLLFSLIISSMTCASSMGQNW